MLKQHDVLRVFRSIVYNVLFLSYIVSLAIPVTGMKHFLSIVSILALLLSLIGIGLFYQAVVGLALAGSFAMLWIYDLYSWEILYHFASLTNIIVLIAYASLFSIPVHLGMYPRKLYLHFKSRVASFKSLYATFSVTTYLLCSVMGTPGIPTVRSSLYLFLRKLPEHFRKEFQSITYVRAFILVIFWTPVAAANTVALAQTGANAMIVLPIVFVLSIVYLFIDIQTADWRLRKKLGPDAQGLDSFRARDESRASGKTKKSLIIFLLILCVFIGAVFLFSHFSGYSILDSVIFMILPFSFLWALALRRGKRYMQTLSRRFAQDVPKLSPQIALFISFGFMINVISMSGLSEGINALVDYLQAWIGPFVLLVISIIVVALTWLGILPQLVVVFVTQTLDLRALGLNPEWFVIAIVGAALSGSSWSPFAVNSNIVAVTIDEKPINVVRRNIIFSINLLVITSLLAIILQVLYP